jgi:hypothetical protein
MLNNLYFASAGFEPVFGWLEQHPGHAVEVWGLEEGRRMALIAYSDGAGDDFGWSNWARAAYDDPSELCALFEQLELVAEGEAASQLQAAFPGTFRAELADG